MPAPGSSPLEAIAAEWQGRPVVAIVDLDALSGNVGAIRSRLGPGVRLMAVVKGNGYGHGALPTAKAALRAGADALAVATVDEGAQLRGAGIEGPILVFGAIGAHERSRTIGHRLSLVVSDAGFARGLAATAKVSLAKEPVSVHLKIDTGMRRFGATPDEAVEVARTIVTLDALRLDGVMCHFASADAADTTSVRDQVAQFDRCIDAIREAGIAVPAQHLANSAAILRFPEYHRDMVRLGIAMYGLLPDANSPLPEPMKPVLTVHGRITRVFDLAPGDRVGYGGTYESPGNERAALVAIGYADGYRRSLSSAGWMSIRGLRAEVLGRVSMDQTIVRVPQGLDIAAGEPVMIAGDGTAATAGAPTLDDLAAVSGTIGYELATGLAPRLPRLYVQGGQVVAIADLAGYRELAATGSKE